MKGICLVIYNTHTLEELDRVNTVARSFGSAVLLLLHSRALLWHELDIRTGCRRWMWPAHDSRRLNPTCFFDALPGLLLGNSTSFLSYTGAQKCCPRRHYCLVPIFILLCHGNSQLLVLMKLGIFQFWVNIVAVVIDCIIAWNGLSYCLNASFFMFFSIRMSLENVLEEFFFNCCLWRHTLLQ